MKTKRPLLTLYVHAAWVAVLAGAVGFTAVATEIEAHAQEGAAPWTHLDQDHITMGTSGGGWTDAPPLLPGAELCAGKTDIECVYREAAPEDPGDDE